jgi:3-hydroxyisobutyrate dehydrogenase-like beta-hydroxyacid dehydrogenase
MILGCMEVLAEAQTLSEQTGIGAEAVNNLVKGTISYTSAMSRDSYICPTYRHPSRPIVGLNHVTMLKITDE